MKHVGPTVVQKPSTPYRNAINHCAYNTKSQLLEGSVTDFHLRYHRSIHSNHHPSIEAGARILLFLPASLLINRENCDGVHRETSVFDSAVCAVTVAWVVAPLSLF